ncbi:FMN-binding protein [Streptacidiphilus sp. EB103A]|uniref:FMN-binding protein n=1 Tax=Streptacidiphilus sp. EB103A TaxID=3156275 RepID=UPI003516239C
MKKKHPLRRVLMATVSTVSGVILLLALKPTSAPASAAAGMPAASAATSAPAKGAASPPSTSAGSKQTTAAAAQARTITGTTVQTQYGPVQVQITVSGKRLTGTTLVQYPNSSGRSIQLAASSLPVLTKEAVAAQSAKIDAVSGASYTSAGYKKSLQSALDMAGI